MTEAKKELIRVVTADLKDGVGYRLKKVMVSSGDPVKPGQRLALLEVTRSKKVGDSVVQSVSDERVHFEPKIYTHPKIVSVLVEEGQQLTAGKAQLFTYVVEETFTNLIEEQVRQFCKIGSNLSIGSNISKKKLANAVAAYAPEVDQARVLYLYDPTFLGGAKEGFLITDSGMYLKGTGLPSNIRFSEIRGVDLQERPRSGTTQMEKVLVIRHGEADIELRTGNSCIQLEPFKTFIDSVRRLSEDGFVKEFDGLLIVQDMSPTVKLSYLRLLVWLTRQDDAEIDQRELTELQVLMTQLNFDADLRAEVRKAITTPETDGVAEQVRSLLEGVPTGSEQALAISLMKDAVRVYRASKRDEQGNAPKAAECDAILELASHLDVKPDQVAFVEEACIQDERILAGEISDEQLMQVSKDLSAKAAAVGVPIAAVYLSGSVVGLSAAGITSGLATLGLGGVLGLSSMVTGVGAAIILGVGVYRGVRWLTGGAERDKASRRELMLQEVLRIHQKAIANLAEDISFFAHKLVALTADVETNKVLIKKISGELTIFSKALAQLRSKEEGFEKNLQQESERQAA